jgi:uncharacterized protein (DUF2267 family)
MTATGIFDRTVGETNDWLADLNYELDCADSAVALQALRSVLHALREELSVEQSAQLTAQFPTLIRGFYYEGWRPKNGVHHSDLEAFLEHVAQGCGSYAEIVEPYNIAASVFAVLERHVSGECAKIRASLPKDLRGLWPETA